MLMYLKGKKTNYTMKSLSLSLSHIYIYICGARPRNNGLFPNSGPSEERPVQRETTYEALLNPNKRQGNLSEE